MKAQIKLGMSDAEYDKLPGLRASLLTKGRETMADFRWAEDHPRDPSQAMIIGQALHKLILQPDEFPKHFARAPSEEKRKAADKAAWAEMEARGLWPIRKDDWDNIHRMRDAVVKHETARELLALPALREAVVTWEDEKTGIPCKAKLDVWVKSGFKDPWTQQEYPCVIDLKTSRNPTERDFAMAMWNFGYHIQAAHYLAGADAVASAPRKWVFIVVRNEPPHLVKVYDFHESGIDFGRTERDQIMAQLKEAKDSGLWPGYPPGIDSINLPHWTFAGKD